MDRCANRQIDASRQPDGAGRAEQLQFLRVLAFWLIYIWHADSWTFSIFSAGSGAACAVSFFIMLSGLVTAYSHFDDEITVTPRAVGAYMKRKLKKLYPLYIFTMLFAVAYSKIPGNVALGEYADLGASLKLLLRNALMIQSWFPSDFFSFNVVGWYVSVILFLYLLTLPMLALALKLRRTRRPALGYCAGIALMALAATAYCYALRDTDITYTHYVLPVARIWEYGIGMCLGCLARLAKRRVSEIGPVRVLLCTVAEAATLALWIAAPYLGYPAWQLAIVHWLLPNALVLLAFAVGGGLLSRVFRVRPLVALGDLMFECFLLHTVVINLYSRCVSGQQTRQLGNALRQAKQAGEAAAQLSAQGRVFNLAFCLLVTLLLARLIHGPTRPGRSRQTRAL